MIRQLFSIYDIKAEVYLPLQGFLTKGEAIREFTRIVNDTTVPISKNPEDFSFFHMGFIDQGTGKGEFLYPPVPVITAIECVKSD